MDITTSIYMWGCLYKMVHITMFIEKHFKTEFKKYLQLKKAMLFILRYFKFNFFQLFVAVWKKKKKKYKIMK